MTQTFQLHINGKQMQVSATAATPLLYVLRNDLNLKGARFGCGQGDCGACTVLMDGQPVQSCDISLELAAQSSIQTVEGLGGENGRPHPIQQAMLDEQAGQCGYCMTGIIMRAKALLDDKPNPSRAEIASALDGHLCRCGSHPRILRALTRAANAMGEPPQ